jgi:hypothetical protein
MTSDNSNLPLFEIAHFYVEDSPSANYFDFISNINPNLFESIRPCLFIDDVHGDENILDIERVKKQCESALLKTQFCSSDYRLTCNIEVFYESEMKSYAIDFLYTIIEKYKDVKFTDTHVTLKLNGDRMVLFTNKNGEPNWVPTCLMMSMMWAYFRYCGGKYTPEKVKDGLSIYGLIEDKYFELEERVIKLLHYFFDVPKNAYTIIPIYQKLD